MIEVFIHEEYVNKRREQKKQQQQQQPRRRRQMRALQIETADKVKLPAAAAAPGQQRPRDQNHQQAAVPRSPVGSPTAADAATTATFRDHFFDYLKPY